MSDTTPTEGGDPVIRPQLAPEEREALDAAELREIIADNREAGEAATLRALLRSSSTAYPRQDGRYLDLTDEGGELAGFETVFVEEGDDDGWVRRMYVVTRGPSGTHYGWSWARGLTESQDSHVLDDEPKPVERHEETRVIVTWTPIQPSS
jgi:hypothetical protein